MSTKSSGGREECNTSPWNMMLRSGDHIAVMEVGDRGWPMLRAVISCLSLSPCHSWCFFWQIKRKEPY